MFQVGVILPNYSRLGHRENLEAIARAADDLGYDSIWTTDHVMMARGQEEPYGHVLEALLSLTYLAGFTRRVKLGISVLVFPMRQPVLIAKQVATLDQLSGGRVILGVGAGWNEREFGFLGAEFGNRGRRFNEAIQVLRTLWTEPDPQFEGEFVSFKDALFSPRPLQPGGPPIWLGGPSEAALRRAATLCDGWHPVGASVDEFRQGMQRIAELSNGRSITGSLRLRVSVGRTLPEERGRTGAIRATASGTPDQVITTLKNYQAVGLQHLVAGFDESGLQAYLEDMRRFAEEVRPALNSSGSQ